MFAYGYYTAMQAIAEGLEQVDGDLSDDHAAFREALANLELDAPLGPIKLDENRQAIMDNFLQQIGADTTGDGVPDAKTIKTIPQVDQTFARLLQRARRRRPTGRTRSARRRIRLRGRSRVEEADRPGLRPLMTVPATASAAAQADGAEPILRLRGVGRRFGGVTPCDGVDLDVFPGERRAILGPNGAGQDDALQSRLG